MACFHRWADGKLVMGGNFTSVNGSALSTITGVNRISRIRSLHHVLHVRYWVRIQVQG